MAKNKKETWNYVIMRSGFGDYWVGKIKLPVDNKSIFTTFEEATENAMDRTDSKDNTYELEEALDEGEEEVETIRKEMEKWIAR